MEADNADKVHGRTVRRALNTSGYHYCRPRKKGFCKNQVWNLSKQLIKVAANLNARLDFCKNNRKRKPGQSLWNKHVAIYLDAKGFQYKIQPLREARAPSPCEWRKINEGLKSGCTAKGSKEGCVNVNFMIVAFLIVVKVLFYAITIKRH